MAFVFIAEGELNHTFMDVGPFEYLRVFSPKKDERIYKVLYLFKA